MFVDAQALFDRDDRDERDDDPATLHVVGLAGEEVVGAVRLYPLGDDGLWKGDRLAVLPAERALQLGAMLVRFAVRTAGERGGRRMVAQIQVRNVRFFERLGWHCVGDPAPMLGAPHQPMAIGPQPPPRPVSGAMPRSQTVARSRPDSRCRARESSKCPQTAQARPRRSNTAQAAPASAAVVARRNPKLGNVRSQRRTETPSGRGSRSTSSTAPQPADSSSWSSEPAAPGIETSRAAWQSPASATSTSASPSVRRRAGARSRSELKKSLSSPRYRPVEAERGEQDVARSGGRGAQRSAREARARRRERRRPADRQVPADDLDAEQVRGPREAFEDELGMSLVGADQHVENRERPPAHGADVGDVRDDGRGAGRVRVRGHEGREDRLAAEHDPLVAVGDQRAVVAVPDRAEPAHEPEVALGAQGGQVAHCGRERVGVGHRRDLSALREIRIGDRT